VEGWGSLGEPEMFVECHLLATTQKVTLSWNREDVLSEGFEFPRLDYALVSIDPPFGTSRADWDTTPWGYKEVGFQLILGVIFVV
jgi:hypothetical protein